jgi:hypothetical protein
MAKDRIPIELRKTTRKVITLLNSKQMIEIRKVSVKEYNQLTGGTELVGLDEIQRDDPEKRKKIEAILKARFDSYTPEQKEEYKKKNIRDNDKVIIAATIDPKITPEPSDDTIGINELDDIDYYYLLNQIIEFSWGTRQDLKPFREEQTPASN